MPTPTANAIEAKSFMLLSSSNLESKISSNAAEYAMKDPVGFLPQSSRCASAFPRRGSTDPVGSSRLSSRSCCDAETRAATDRSNPRQLKLNDRQVARVLTTRKTTTADDCGRDCKWSGFDESNIGLRPGSRGFATKLNPHDTELACPHPFMRQNCD